MDKDKEITITYETLYEILRIEKDKLELQKLSGSFLQDVVSYLGEKQNILEQSQQELFSLDEKANTINQIEKIKRILREIYNRRERKIINMAVDKSRTKSDLIDTSSLLKEEKELFEAIVKLLDNNRDGVLLRILNAKLPEKERMVAEDSKDDVKKDSDVLKPTMMIRFKHTVPKFVGLDGEELGPFDEEDVASLPREIASVLVNKERAEEIKEG